MTALALLAELRRRRVELIPEGSALRYRAPQGALTAELREAVARHKPELVRLLTRAVLDADAGELAAVKLRNTIIGDLWLVADAEALVEHPDIVRQALPVFFFDEIDRLRGKTAAELHAIGLVKATFPTSRVLQ
jgi:hypothetical protein